MLSLTYQKYETALSDHPLLLVDFFAEWCAPCKMMEPVLADLEKARPEIAVARVNIDKEDDLAVENDISLLPTVVLYRDGVEVERFVGTMTLAQLSAKLKLALGES